MEGKWWHRLDDGRIQCDLCPRDCRLHEGQRGLCFVRQTGRRRDGAHDLRPLLGLLRRPDREEAAEPFLSRHERALVRHRGLQPGVQVLPELGHLEVAARWTGCRIEAAPRRIAEAARAAGLQAVAFTYNDPVIFAEYAMDTADACHALGLHTVAVTAGYMHAAAAPRVLRQDGRRQRRPEGLHRGVLLQQTAADASQPVLDTLQYLRHETGVLVRDHDAADPRARTTPTRKSKRVRAGSRASSGPTCRCTSRPSIPTTR